MSKRRSSLAQAFQGSMGRQDSKTETTPTSNQASHEPVKPESPQPMITSGEIEMVPGPKGQRVPADQPVNMTFTVTARERYLWNLELSRRGMTGVSVLRRALNALLEST
jgi:hypothetical protein